MTHFFKQLFVLLSITILFTNCISNTEKAKLIGKYKNRSNENNKVNSEKGLIENNESIILEDNIYLYSTSTTGQIIKHSYYTVSYSEKDEQPEWVAYKITNASINDHIVRTNDYREDPFVKTGSASPYDYSESGYDMGHLAPAKTMSRNLTSMSESFYLSNICPQTPAFNRGIWKRLEEKVRYWSEMNDSIYEVTGPILDHPIGHIGKNNVTVPRAFYKTLLGFKNGKIKGIGFIMPNEKSQKSIYSYAVSIDEIEKITGIDFYNQLDNSIQDLAEENKDLKIWLLNKKI
jgi:endonuclease G